MHELLGVLPHLSMVQQPPIVKVYLGWVDQRGISGIVALHGSLSIIGSCRQRLPEPAAARLPHTHCNTTSNTHATPPTMPRRRSATAHNATPPAANTLNTPTANRHARQHPTNHPATRHTSTCPTPPRTTHASSRQPPMLIAAAGGDLGGGRAPTACTAPWIWCQVASRRLPAARPTAAFR